MKPQDILDLLKETFSEFGEDKVQRLGAALAYYTIFSLAPLLVIVIAIAGFVFGEEAARNQIVGQISGLVGESGAELIQTMIQGASEPRTGIIATIVGIVTLVLGAGGVFGQLRDSLNTIWEVEPKPGPGGIQGVLHALKNNFFSFTMVLGTGFLLLVSLVLSAALTALGDWISGTFSGIGPLILGILNFVISFGVITLLFALLFKIVPDAEIAWKDVWIGAIITALLFTIGRFVIGRFIATQSAVAAFGAAAALVLLLIWIYYSAQILFLGAEFTQVYANRFGSRIAPAEDAMPLTKEAAAKQGIPKEESAEARGKKGAAQPAPGAAAASHRVATMEAVDKRVPRLPIVYYITAAVGFIIGLLAGNSRKAKTNADAQKRRKFTRTA
jgi:membrane protein